MEREVFINILKERKIHYKMEDDRIIVIKGTPANPNDAISKGEEVINIPIESIPNNVTFTINGNVILRGLKSIPSGIIFNNKRNVDLSHVKSIESDTLFNNRGDVYLNTLENIPNVVEFNNRGGVYLYSAKNIKGAKFNNLGEINTGQLANLPDGFEFNNTGSLWMNGLTSIPAGTKFNKIKNLSDVKIEKATSISPDVIFPDKWTGTIFMRIDGVPEGFEFNGEFGLCMKGKSINPNIKFNNGGDVILDDVIQITNIKFNNGGNVKLTALNRFPDSNSEFNNGGNVIIPKLDEIIKINGISNKKLYVVMGKGSGHSMFKN